MPFGDPAGATYLGDGGGWETPRQERERERQDEITLRAVDHLTTAHPHAECVGCERLVHHADRTAHARSCRTLRQVVEDEIQTRAINAAVRHD